MATDPTFAFVGDPRCLILDIVFAFWIMITFDILLTLLFYILNYRHHIWYLLQKFPVCTKTIFQVFKHYLPCGIEVIVLVLVKDLEELCEAAVKKTQRWCLDCIATDAACTCNRFSKYIIVLMMII
jgi:hypothetical protein